jgi:tetratricopeptide (TPR) repeat protein
MSAAPTIPESVVLDILLDVGGRGTFSFLFGAGCSVESGIPLAGQITADAHRRIFIAEVGREPVSEVELDAVLKRLGLLTQPGFEYGEALEFLRPSPSLRRTYLEQYFKDKEPSQGYQALSVLLRGGLVRNLFTTNFDDLVERSASAIGSFRVVTHDLQGADSEIESTTPTLYKLHGDFLYSNIRNTREECSFLDSEMNKRLAHSVRRGGLVVLGYAGNDQSVMKSLSKAYEENSNSSLFWMVRPESTISVSAMELLASIKNAFVVTTAGFDDFMVKGATLALRRNSVERAALGSGSRNAFVSEAGGQESLIDRIEDRLLHGTGVVALYGRTGSGKTSVLKEVVKRRVSAGGYGDYFAPTGATSFLVQTTEMLDKVLKECLPNKIKLVALDGFDQLDSGVQMAIRAAALRIPILVACSSESVAQFLSTNGVEEVMSLSEVEAARLLELLVDKHPRARSRYAALQAEGKIEDVLARLDGWPRAIELWVSALSDSTLATGDVAAGASGTSVLGTLLTESFSALTGEQIKVLAGLELMTGPAPMRLVARIGELSLNEANAAIRGLVGYQLVKEFDSLRVSPCNAAVGRFACSLLSPLEMESLRKTRSRVLVEECNEYGGQPRADWSNFRSLDEISESLISQINRLRSGSEFRDAYSLMNMLFSYFVERGHWEFVEQICGWGMSADSSSRRISDWAIWSAWTAFYFREDFAESVRLSRLALGCRGATKRQKIESCKRMGLALAKLGDYGGAAESLALARSELGRSTVDLAADVENACGSIDLWAARVPKDFRKAMIRFESALTLATSENNLREQGVAILGLARCYSGLGELDLASESCTSAIRIAWATGWLRGIAEGNFLIADLASQDGKTVASEQARQVAESHFRDLRRESIR